MSLRSPRERIIQTLAYEFGGLLLSIPLYLFYSGHASQDGAVTMVALSIAVMIWSPVHNTVFDWLDLRLTGRLASDRPQKWRVVHAISHETTTVVVTTPLLVWLGGHGWVEALLVDMALGAVYAGYAYVFHILYDRLRPVRPA